MSIICAPMHPLEMIIAGLIGLVIWIQVARIAKKDGRPAILALSIFLLAFYLWAIAQGALNA